MFWESFLLLGEPGPSRVPIMSFTPYSIFRTTTTEKVHMFVLSYNPREVEVMRNLSPFLR